jgi:exodeoxyribonuclease VII large subunit
VLDRRVGRGLQSVDEREYRMRDRVRGAIEARERARRNLELRLRRFDIRPRLATGRRGMETARATAVEAMHLRLARRRAGFEQLAAKLEQLSPLRILDRGYAIVSNETGIVKDPSAAPPASRIRVRLAKGGLEAVVTE